jgi:cysteine desulfurase
VQMVFLSAHKCGGPKGVGALIIPRGHELRAQIKGGGQEMGRRSGTENVIGIAGMGAAAAAAQADLAAGRWEQIAQFRNILETGIEAAEKNTIFVGKDLSRLPNTSCFVTPGWKGETQVMAMDLAGFAVSAGSACSSGKVKQSRVLRALGLDDAAAASALRVSLGLETTQDQVLRFVQAWTEKRARLRAA